MTAIVLHVNVGTGELGKYTSNRPFNCYQSKNSSLYCIRKTNSHIEHCINYPILYQHMNKICSIQKYFRYHIFKHENVNSMMKYFLTYERK